MLAASPRRRWRRWATPDCAPPEMLTDDVAGIEAPRQSPAIDVFAAASVLFELACARLPFGEKGAMSASPYRLKAEGAPTPASVALDGCNAGACAGVTPCLGLVRVCEGYVMGQPHWVDPAGAGCVDGSLATDDSGLCNVEADVSSRHLRVWFADGAWWASDLGSANGSWLRPASGPSEVRLEPGERHALAPGDELRLGAFTRFVLLVGLPG